MQWRGLSLDDKGLARKLGELGRKEILEVRVMRLDLAQNALREVSRIETFFALFPELVELRVNLAENQIQGLEGITRALEASRFSLRRLAVDLSRNKITRVERFLAGLFARFAGTLEALSLTLDQNNISCEELDVADEALSRCAALQRLELSLPKNSVRSVAGLLSQVARLPELRALRLNLWMNALSAFALDVSALAHLEMLELNLRHNLLPELQLRDGGLPALRELVLLCAGNMAQSVRNVYDFVARAKQLRTLQLEFAENDLSALEELDGALAGKQLAQLRLNYSRNKIASLEPLARGMAQLAGDLEVLHLNFGRNQLGIGDLQRLKGLVVQLAYVHDLELFLNNNRFANSDEKAVRELLRRRVEECRLLHAQICALRRAYAALPAHHLLQLPRSKLELGEEAPVTRNSALAN